MKNAVFFYTDTESQVPSEEKNIQIPIVDEWVPEPDDIILTNAKGIIIMPVTKILQLDATPGIDYFLMNTKKCYNSQTMRDHTCLYLNYFEKFLDPSKELLIAIARIKYMIDAVPQYTENDFINDIKNMLFNERFKEKVNRMVEINYSLDLLYKNIPENLQYTNEHAKIMLRMSIFMNMCIPLITHFAYVHKVPIIDNFIMLIFDLILNLYPEVNIYNKLYETTYSNVSKSEIKHAPIWAKQDIRGKDPVTHSYASVSNIILNIMPKYTFDKSIISLNFTSINKNTGCQVIEIEFEYNFMSLSSSKRDGEDNSSDFDQIA